MSHNKRVGKGTTFLLNHNQPTPSLHKPMSIYHIISPDFPDASVTINGNRAIAYGVAESIFKQQKVDVVIYDDEHNRVDSFTSY